MKEEKQGINKLIRESFFGLLSGLACGALCLLFFQVTNYAYGFSSKFPLSLFFLPLTAIVITFLYDELFSKEELYMGRLFYFAKGHGNLSPWIAPLVSLSTFLGYLTGASLGRTGPSLQIGGVTATLIRSFLPFNIAPEIAIMCGIASGFTAIMNSPLAGMVFGVEILLLRKDSLWGLIPAALSSYITWLLSRLLNLQYVDLHADFSDSISLNLAIKIAFLGLIATLAGRLYCFARKRIAITLALIIKNKYIRALIVAASIVALFSFSQAGQCHASDFSVAAQALKGNTHSFTWMWKIFLTALTLGCGIRGGEIGPVLIMGATLGCSLSPLLAIDPSLGAAIALVGALSSVTNCTIALFILGCESINGSLLGLFAFAIATLMARLFSGKGGLYSEQSTLMP